MSWDSSLAVCKHRHGVCISITATEKKIQIEKLLHPGANPADSHQHSSSLLPTPALLIRSGHKARFVTTVLTLLWLSTMVVWHNTVYTGQPICTLMMGHKTITDLKQGRASQSDDEGES